MFSLLKTDLDKSSVYVFTAYMPKFNLNKQELWRYLSREEKEKVEKFSFNYLKDMYVTTHGLLRLILSFFLELEPQTVKYCFNKFGKPYVYEANIQFNMSHSKDLVAYIVALTHEVGIDVEWKDRNLDLKNVCEYALNSEEIIWFQKLTLEEKFHAFFNVWTKKEAIIKAIGQGLSYPLTNINVLNCSDNAKVCHKDKENELYAYTLPCESNYAGSFAISRQLDRFFYMDIAEGKLVNLAL